MSPRREQPTAVDSTTHRPEPHVGLGYRISVYLEGEAGARLTVLQRELLSDLAKNPSQIEAYAYEGATNEEIAAMLKLPVAVMAPFDMELAKSRAELSLRIRRLLLSAAEKASGWEALNCLVIKYLGGGNTPAGTAS